MSEARKRGGFNARVADAHERKLQVEEDRRIWRMEREAEQASLQRRKIASGRYVLVNRGTEYSTSGITALTF